MPTMNKGHLGPSAVVEGKGLDFFLKEVLKFYSITKPNDEVAKGNFLN